MKKILLLIIIFVSILSAIRGQHTIVLETDFDGKVVKGSKTALIEEIRKGKSVRIGWQLDFDKDKKADFDHWSEAEFITILGDDVFTQIRNINYQIPNGDIPQVSIIPSNTMWTGILGTNSILMNRFVYGELVPDYDENGNPIITDEIQKELAKREVSSWKVATFWAIEM